MNQNKPFYVALVVATCIVMVVCGFVLNFAWGMRSEVAMAKSNIVNEQKYAVEQIKKAGNEFATKSKEIQAATQALENHKAELTSIESDIRQTIKEYENARHSVPESVQKSESNARAFLVIWQSSLEDEDDPVFVVSEKDIPSDGGVNYYHTLSRVFSPKGLIAVARLKDPKIKTVTEAIAQSRSRFKSIVIPLY